MPQSELRWAQSPTTVIDSCGQRRAIIRHAIGESSCASSTITWPYAHLRSPRAASASVGPPGSPRKSTSPGDDAASPSRERRPPRRRGRGSSGSPRSSAASSRSGTSAAVHSLSSSGSGRCSSLTSSAESSPLPAARINTRELKRSRKSSVGVSVGHSRAARVRKPRLRRSAARISGRRP